MLLYELFIKEDGPLMDPMGLPVPDTSRTSSKIKSTPLSKQLVSLTAQIKAQNLKNLTREKLLKYYRDNGISLSSDDLTKMVKQEPLRNFIDNIKGDSEGNLVIFKGQIDPMSSTDTTPKHQEKEVASMAKKAMKNHSK